MRRRFLIGVVAAASWLASSARATPLELYGFGPRSAGMGLAGAAAVDGAPALYYNPAGVAAIEGIHLSVGYQYAPTRLTLNGHDIGARDPRATEVMVGFGLKTFGRDSGLALGLHMPDYGVFGAWMRPVDAPKFVVVDQRRDRLHLMAGYGISVLDKLQLGAGMAMFSDTIGDVGILYGNPQGATIDATLPPTMALHAGLKLGPLAGLTTGLSYRASLVSKLAFPTDLHAAIAGVDGDVVLESVSYEFFTPRQVTLGEAWRPRPDLQVTGDLIWSEWSAMRDLSGSLRVHIDDRGGNLPPAPPGWAPESPHFRNTLAPHVGVEWQPVRGGAHEVFVRAGYAYEPTPAPAPTSTRNLIDADRNLVTAGFGVWFRNPPVVNGALSLDAHLGYARMVSRTVLRTDPTDPYGAYTAGGELMSMGLTASIVFDAPYLRHPR